MSNTYHPLEELYQEELYSIPAGVQFILSKPFESLQPEEETLLSKLADAIKLGMDNIRISNGIDSLHQSSKAIIFGADILPEIPLYEIARYEGIQVIKADAPDVLDKNDANKKVLWKALRTMFSI